MNVTGITALVFVTWCVLASSADASTMTGFGNRKIGNERTRTATFANDPDEFFPVYCSNVGRDLTRVVPWRDADDASEGSDGPFRLLHNGDVAPLWHALRWHFKHDWKEDWDDWRDDFGKHRRIGWRHHHGRRDVADPVTPAAVPAPEPGSLVLLISGAAVGLRRLRRYAAGVKPV